MKNVPKIKHKFSLKIVFPGYMGLTVPSYSACPYKQRMYRYVIYIFPVHTHFFKMYLSIFLTQQECKIHETTCFGTVHSHKLVLVMLHKHFTSSHSTVFNSICIITLQAGCGFDSRWCH